MALSLILYSAIASLIKQSIPSHNLMTFSSENGKDVLKIKPDDFLFAEAMENYVAIFFDSKGKTKRHLIRKPLKILAKELENYSGILRIHRSYLVNTYQIHSVKQTKGKVLINIGDKELSVSKKHQKNFLTGTVIHP
ncbi:hypothetical protein GCM10022260_14880 [Gaetbulibacter aestuarii]